MGGPISPFVPNPVPQRAKPWCLHGERGEAHSIVTQDWLSKGYIERPPTIANPDTKYTGKGGPSRYFGCEWLSKTFVVPKKVPTSPGGG